VLMMSSMRLTLSLLEDSIYSIPEQRQKVKTGNFGCYLGLQAADT